ncbi:MAG: hypothetical protein JSW16_02510 [Dehalococcoidales bacterium]|nr:MAG: hypothetical protein JSW16_02510 [Dehalococcoidales bacterium]
MALSIFIVIVLIGFGFLASINIYRDLNNQMAISYAEGLEEGRAQGYLAGKQDGSRTGYQEGSRIGYQEGQDGDTGIIYEEGEYFIHNPFYDELPGIWERAEATTAKGIHEYAEANGIRVAYVRCQIARKAHEGMVYIIQLVAFETVDNGLVIIEPRSGKEVKVAVGESYSGLNNFPARPYDDTVTKISVVW